MSKRRFFINYKEIKGSNALLTGKEHNHLAQVLRLKAGDELFLFTDKGDEFQAVIVEVKRKESLLRIIRKLKDEGIESLLEVTLLQAIPRGSKMDTIVQKATELGTNSIIPLITARSVKPKNPAEKQRRWQRISLQAAKQCGRRKAAHIYPPNPIREIELSKIPKLRLILYEAKGRGLKDILSQYNDQQIGLMVGPEGGWQDEEIHWTLNKGFIPINLGQRILRTETASLVALAILQYQLGDLG